MALSRPHRGRGYPHPHFAADGCPAPNQRGSEAGEAWRWGGGTDSSQEENRARPLHSARSGRLGYADSGRL